MSKIKIPRTIKTAGEQLASLEALATATEWERAAIVAAFVECQETAGRIRKSENMESSTDFAARGIAGLKSTNTVKRYHDAWLSQRPRPKPGASVELDGLPDWTSVTPKADPGRRMPVRLDEPAGIEQLARAIKSDPKVAKAATRALSEALDERLAEAKAAIPFPQPKTAIRPMLDGMEWATDVRRAAELVRKVSAAVVAADGRVEPVWYESLDEALKMLSEAVLDVRTALLTAGAFDEMTGGLS